MYSLWLTDIPVLVTLSAQYPPPDFQYPERRIVLESKSVDSASEKVKIGRSSKRLPALEPKNTNALFDSPVMSREHAELYPDWYHKVGSNPNVQSGTKV